MSGYGEELATSVLLTEMAGFSIREAQFRKKMEKFKAAQTKDLVFEVSILFLHYFLSKLNFIGISRGFLCILSSMSYSSFFSFFFTFCNDVAIDSFEYFCII